LMRYVRPPVMAPRLKRVWLGHNRALLVQRVLSALLALPPHRCNAESNLPPDARRPEPGEPQLRFSHCRV
jgi:hypothetical protein